MAKWSTSHNGDLGRRPKRGTGAECWGRDHGAMPPEAEKLLSLERSKERQIYPIHGSISAQYTAKGRLYCVENGRISKR